MQYIHNYCHHIINIAQRIPRESYTKSESDEKTEAQGLPPPPSSGTRDSREEAGDDDAVAAASAEKEEGREGEEGSATEVHEGVRRAMDNKDDEGAPLTKRPKLDEAEGTSSGGNEGEGEGEGRADMAAGATTGEKEKEEGEGEGGVMVVESASERQENLMEQ